MADQAFIDQVSGADTTDSESSHDWEDKDKLFQKQTVTPDELYSVENDSYFSDDDNNNNNNNNHTDTEWVPPQQIEEEEEDIDLLTEKKPKQKKKRKKKTKQKPKENSFWREWNQDGTEPELVCLPYV